jgi:hypothetical protein
MFPLQRGRRLRVNESIRSLVRETTLSPSDFMFPMFIEEGENYKVEIASMPGIFRRSIDLTVEEVKELFALGIRAVNIYVKVDESLKDNTGKEAWNPDRMLIQSPDRNWDRLFASHPDHMAAGEAAIQAVYPDSRNPFAFEDLLKVEGLQPWRVKEVWVMSTQNPDHFIDITTTFDKKMKALHSHVSQTAHNENLETMVREWGERNALANNLPAGSVAEVFKIVNTN